MPDDRIRIAEEEITRKCERVNEAIRGHAGFRKKASKHLSCGLGLLHEEKAFTLPAFGRWFPLIKNRTSWHVCRQCGRVTMLLDKITSFKSTKLGYIQAPDPDKVVLALIRSADNSGL